MRFPVINVWEVVVGGLLIALGLLYLSAQFKTIDKLINIANETLLDDENIYQQHSNVTRNTISDDELCAIVMGYREYPIVIDGVTISTDGNDYDYYLSLIKDGSFTKKYQCNSNNQIVQIIYVYINES